MCRLNVWLCWQLDELKSIGGNVGGLSGRNSKSSKKSTVSDDPIDIQRREKVKDAMLHAWSSYEKYAWGQNELQVSLICFFIFSFLICFVLLSSSSSSTFLSVLVV